MHTVRISVLVFCACALAWSGFSPVAHAQIGFGGFVIIAIPCTGNDDGSTLVYQVPVGETSPSSVTIGVSTVLYPYFAYFEPSVPVLGEYEPGPIPCLVGECPYCVEIGEGPLVLFEGTGL